MPDTVSRQRIVGGCPLETGQFDCAPKTRRNIGSNRKNPRFDSRSGAKTILKNTVSKQRSIARKIGNDCVPKRGDGNSSIRTKVRQHLGIAMSSDLLLMTEIRNGKDRANVVLSVNGHSTPRKGFILTTAIKQMRFAESFVPAVIAFWVCVRTIRTCC
jgi:hypothetical protein